VCKRENRLNSVGGGVGDLMSREQSPVQKKAFKLWCELGRPRSSEAIAEALEVKPELIRKWKNYYKWKNEPDPRPGAPKGNKNAKGNKGGKGAPIGNDRAVTSGLFRKILPDDEETREIFDATEEMSPLDMLWYKIRVAWTNFMRSQKIQYVKDKDDVTKVLKKHSPGEWGDGVEWEYQHAHDKQGAALTQQAAAMTAFTRALKQYGEMLRELPPEDVKKEQRQRFELLKAQVEKTKNEAKTAGKGNDKTPLHITIDYGDDES